MYLSGYKLKSFCASRNLTLSKLLKIAGVSRSTYYELLQKRRAVPKSVEKIASVLNVPVSELLVDEKKIEREERELQEGCKRLLSLLPDLDFIRTRHILLLLREKPVDRLNRALLRGK